MTSPPDRETVRSDVAEVLIRKLEVFAPLSDVERDAVSALAGQTRSYSPREDVIRQGDRTEHVNLLLEGFACRYKTLEDGRRQILSFFVPGVICDLNVFILERMDHSIGALSPCVFGAIHRRQVDELIDRQPRITRALWWCTLVGEATAREWLLNVGQRSAYERAAHLFCELYWRLGVVGLVRDGTFDFPVTQTELGDALGLSAVHVNRTLQELRRDGLISTQGRELTVLDVEGLERAAMFDPSYLHLTDTDVGAQRRREK